MKITFKRALITIALVAGVAFMAAAAKPAKAYYYPYSGYAGLAGLIAVNNTTTPGAPANDLGNLIVLNGLFNNPYTYGGGYYGYSNMAGLAGLVAVNNITTPGATAPAGSYNNLGNLIVLNGLFNNPYSYYY